MITRSRRTDRPGVYPSHRFDPRTAPGAASGSSASFAFVAAVFAAAFAFMSCATNPPAKLAAEWYDIGNAWYDQGNWAKAGAAYTRAIALNPKLGAASYNMARALAESGDYKGALEAIDGVLASDKANVRALTARAWILYKSGDAKAALAAYGKVLELDPKAPDALFNAAVLKSAAGDLDGAIADLEGYVGVKPEDTKALILYARTLAGKERNDEALAAYGKVTDLSKLGAADHLNLAKIHEAARDYAKAIDEYVLVTKADPKDSVSLFALARLRLAEAEDGPGGLEALNKALEAGFSDKKAAADLLAEPVLAEREKVAEALRAKGLVE